MISINCPKCEKVIEVPTLSNYGPLSLDRQEEIPDHIKESLDGVMIKCGGCNKRYRFEYDYEGRVLDLWKITFDSDSNYRDDSVSALKER